MLLPPMADSFLHFTCFDRGIGDSSYLDLVRECGETLTRLWQPERQMNAEVSSEVDRGDACLQLQSRTRSEHTCKEALPPVPVHL